MILVIPIALVGGFILCRMAYIGSAKLSWPWRTIYVALYAVVVVAWAMAAYFHIGLTAEILFGCGILGVAAIVVLTMVFKLEL